MNYKYSIDNFVSYLKEAGYREYTPSGNLSTVYDYAKRIEYVCKKERCSLEKLADNIERLCKEYDYNGAKEHLGAISHRSVINALKAYKNYVNKG